MTAETDTETESRTPPEPEDQGDAEQWTGPEAEADFEESAPDDEDEPRGRPAGQLAAGGASAAAVVLGVLYQLVGVPGLVAGSVAAGWGTVAVVRRRRGHPAPWPFNGSGSGGSAGRSAAGSRLFSGGHAVRAGVPRAGRGGSRLFSAGRSSAAGRPRGAGGGLLAALRRGGGSGSAGGSAFGRMGGRRGAKAGGRTATAGRAGGRHASASGGRARSAGPVRRGASKAKSATGRAMRATGRAARTATAPVSRAARATARQARRAGAWVDRKTGGRAGRAVATTRRFAAHQARRAAGWADRKTGRRFSTAWHAARGAAGFRQARRRAAAVLGGWDAQLTAGLVALLAWITGKWRARKTSETAKTSETSETASEAPADGDSAITASATCSRCGATHTVTIPASEAARMVRCACGQELHFFRAPAEIPSSAEDTKDTPTGPKDRPGPQRTHRRSNTMSGFPLAAMAAEMNAVAAGHAPADMWVVARELDQLAEVPANVAMALRTYTVRLQGDYPIDPAVVEAIHSLYAAQAQLVAAAEEIGPLFRRIHAEDLKREEAPRTNEQAWNV
uniref:hypothetical protein n=1 Tax=Sphaerisporangium sp. CA-236357 TaxID=3240030 RepID=UPI003F492FB0